METETYQIKTGSFEGPFGLLLSLVEERKLFINEISLAQVTEDYLKYINTLNKKNHIEILSFIVVAATLILIKSKSLIPSLNFTDEEKSDIHNLEERLRLYELFTKLSGNLKSKFGKKIIFAPLERKFDFLVFLPDEQITKESMMVAIQDMLGRIPKKIFLPEVEVKKVISIEEMIDRLTERIKNSLHINFKEFALPIGRQAGDAKNREEKIFVIVSFLAMLELIRNGMLDAVQNSYNEDIIISKSV